MLEIMFSKVLMLYQLYVKGSVQSLDDSLKKYAPGFKINNPFSKYTLLRIMLLLLIPSEVTLH